MKNCTFATVKIEKDEKNATCIDFIFLLLTIRTSLPFAYTHFGQLYDNIISFGREYDIPNVHIKIIQF